MEDVLEQSRMRRGRLSAAVLLAVFLAVAPAAPARASHGGSLPNWPELGPPQPGTKAKLPLAFDVCRSRSFRCPARVIEEMYKRWRPLDHKCDHRALFALTYLRTTEEFARTTGADHDFFVFSHWVNHEDAVFGELYFLAYDRWEKGKPVPAAWEIAFEAAASPNLTGIGDLLLGMNAHINRDLPYTLAHVSLARRGGASRKGDHDKVNEFLDRVVDPVQEELARRYDPLFENTDGGPSPLEEIGALQIVRGWRENAWRNAERLIAARDDPDQLSTVRASIEEEARTLALTILAGNTAPGYGATRDAYCRGNGQQGRSHRRRARERGSGADPAPPPDLPDLPDPA